MSKTGTKTETQTDVQVAHADVDDVVEIAARMMAAEEGLLSAEELHEIGRDLDIPEEYMERARKELEVKRKAAERKEREERAERELRKKVLIGGSAALVLVLAIWTFGASSSLRGLHADVEAQRAQVENVRARKVTVTEMYRGRGPSPDRDAELIGAENRIRVESKRYAELAAKYNARAQSFPGSLATALTSLPSSVPANP